MEVSTRRFHTDRLTRLLSSLNAIRFRDRVGEILFYKHKSIVLGRETIQVIKRKIAEETGSGTASLLMKMAGRSVGTYHGKILAKSIRGSSAGLDPHLLRLIIEESNMGFGKMRLEFLNLSDRSAQVHVENCFENAELVPDAAERCTFMSGFLEGAFSQLLEGPVVCRETKCESLPRPACDFEIEKSRLREEND